jgi:hypothetical protein
LADGEEFLARPVLEHLCSYESLLDGTLDLADVARMNDWIDVRDENERRLREAASGND